MNNQFILSPGVLDGFATAYFGAVRVKPEASERCRSAFSKATRPSPSSMRRTFSIVVQGVMDKTSQAISFVAGFAIAGGLIVLASSVAGTRSRRMREVAIFRTVGATKATLVRIFTVEFVAIGIAAGLLGSLLATVLSSVLVARLLEAPYHFRWFPALVATGVTASADGARGLDCQLWRAAQEAAGDPAGDRVGMSGKLVDRDIATPGQEGWTRHREISRSFL